MRKHYENNFQTRTQVPRFQEPPSRSNIRADRKRCKRQLMNALKSRPRSVSSMSSGMGRRANSWSSLSTLTTRDFIANLDWTSDEDIIFENLEELEE